MNNSEINDKYLITTPNIAQYNGKYKATIPVLTKEDKEVMHEAFDDPE